jgi:hypothetical protein
MKATKEELVKDVFYEATNGLRNRDNFIDGYTLIYAIAENNYKWAIKDWWQEVSDGADAREVLDKMFEQTLRNTYNGNLMPTAKSRQVEQAYYTFRRMML